ncbi:FG-GAP repeat domain-containing protein [Streptomyces sp. NPDC007945]|uniref:FG-GAP repeat domain-containing protein n=1 Tax=Streptomyces sp. NPDC007945 TaxID=3364797 RepID=UPI0036E1F4A5
MSVRRTVALALSAALAVTGLTAAAPAAVAADTAPFELTIRESVEQGTLPPHTLRAAGRSGFQLSWGPETRWYDRTWGPILRAPECPTADEAYAYGDLYVCPDPESGGATVHDFVAKRTDRVATTAGETWLPLVAGRQLVRVQPGTDGVTLSFHGFGTNAPADREVRLPGATSQPQVFTQDDTTAVIGYATGATRAVVLLDFATGTVTPLTHTDFTVASASLDEDRIALGGGAGTAKVLVLSRTEPAAPAREVTLPQEVADATAVPGLLGDWVIGRSAVPDWGDITDAAALWAVPLGGGEARRLAATVHRGAAVLPDQDGALHTVGVTGDRSGLLRITQDAAGVPVVEPKYHSLGAPYPVEGLTLSHGYVVAQHASPSSGYRRLRGENLAYTAHGDGTAWGCDALSGRTHCPQFESSATSQRWWADNGDEEVITLQRADKPGCVGCAVAVQVTPHPHRGQYDEPRTVVLPYATPLKAKTILQASGRYVHFLATSGTTTRSLVADIETGQVLRDSTNLNQWLWGGQLWTGSATNGTVSAVDVRTGATVATADLGTSCAFTGLEVVGKWIMRRCASAPGSVVVHDRETKKSVWTRIPAAAKPQLGDGFIAYTATGATTGLYVEDVLSGTAVERHLGDLAAGRDQYVGQGWTVDRHERTVAFVDSWESIRAVGLGGATSRLTVADADVPTTVDFKIRNAAWKPRWWLSKRGYIGQLILKDKLTGRTVRSITPYGGDLGPEGAVWDGRDAGGAYVPNGMYTWTLTMKPSDGAGADLVQSGTLRVAGGKPVWRDLAGGDAAGDLLAVDSLGAVSMYRGNGTGGLSGKIAGTGTKFPSGTILMPFGDTNDDRCNDVLARVGNELRAYRPGCGKVVSASSPYTLIGTGWAQFDRLTAPGDVNGDGHPDVIARQASTGNMFFYAGTSAAYLKPRVGIGADWKLYTTIVGVGDMNKDGRADLVAVDRAGTLWRYDGTTSGRLTARVPLGGGWGVYSAMAGVGDVDGDRRGDLVARSTDGKLWRYSSDGRGKWGGRVLIGTGGWNTFKSLF